MRKSILAQAAAACLFATATAASAAEAPNLTGLWLVERFIPALKTTTGALPPMTPAAKAVYDKRVADRAAGRAVGDPVEICVPHGVPRIMFAPYPMVIVQSGGQVSMIQEANHTFRLIYIDRPQADPDDPKWMGDSRGRWQGETLVVETINNKDATWLDKAGLPHSDKMKVTERLTLSRDGQALTDAITIEDPAFYTAPWTTTVRFNRKNGPMALAERICTLDHVM